MRLHPRLFNRFLLITAGISVIAIVFFGIRYAGNQEEGFRDRLGDGLAVLDSLGIESDGKPVTVLFWATWSEPSLTRMRELTADTSHHVVAAYVRDDSASVRQHMRMNGYDAIQVVNGTAVFQSLKAPGIPTTVTFDRTGRLESAIVGRP